ncbi:hypothetical protein MBBAR_1c02380 [Methanobrevibacter arboriphilus JCM 13429 = DSM 1125]|uniref:Uncharacterized protein n=1 Tax=Methanobrevibacter arboriphilus JCM 13429 = DSM 1125 TaxID=1300164 RepID=A0A1V6N545_METAZ|nr:hypothetical protein [Methanobrevibacter arboriphilus]OQD59830.1 hypothetical protein MBBAR_1c02380 [Methanobrevibacter arboriphilus JCM 13429 = DSM 1125]
MSRKYFYIAILVLCIYFCMNGVAASDNSSYDNSTDFNSDSDYVINESVVNESDTQNKAESVNNSPSEISDFDIEQMNIQSTNYPGNVFNENTGSYFNDLQQAIDNANKGEKLIVFEGYYENIILSRNGLTITCVNQYNSTIGNLYVHYVVGCNISGFTINSLDLYNAHENVFCNNFFDHYNNNMNWPTSNPVIMISISYYNLFESNKIKQNTNGLFILSGGSNSTFRFNLFDKIDYYPYGDIDAGGSYLDLDNNLWYWMEMITYDPSYFESIKNELIRNQGSNVVLDKWIIPKFDIINYKTLLNFNFNNFNEDISSLGSMNKINILYQMYWDYNIMTSEINNGYAELNLPYNINSFYLLIDYYMPIMLFEDESFIFNRNTSNYYKNLQEAIDDVYTLNGHTLELCGSHSSGDIFLNKNLTINGRNLIINNFLINEGGSGSKISNFNIKNLTIKSSNYLNILNNQIENLLMNNSNFNTFFSNNIKNITEIFNSNNLNLSNNRINSIYMDSSDYCIIYLNNITKIDIFNSNNLNISNNQINISSINNSNFSNISSNNIKNNTIILNSNNLNISNNQIDNLYMSNSNFSIISNNIINYLNLNNTHSNNVFSSNSVWDYLLKTHLI